MDELAVEEKNTSNDKQMYSAISFCIMLILVGIPLWWKTTEVYRVSLPYTKIDALSDLNVQIKMNVHIVSIDDNRRVVLLKELQTFFKTSKIYKIEFSQHSADRGIIDSSQTLDELEKRIKHPNFQGSLQLFEIPDLNRFSSQNIITGQNRTVYFSSHTGVDELLIFLKRKILKEDFLMDIISQITLPMNTNFNIKHKMPSSDDFDILFTILNPEPDLLDVQFDLSQGIEEYISPFLRNLEDMNGFHVKSQWLYFVSLQILPKFINSTDKGPHFALSEDLLPHVITPLEKKLASHVSKHPCLNFVLFVTPCALAPLRIYTKKGFPVEGFNAFISPRWGGIQIQNPDRESCLHSNKAVVQPNMHNVMSVFLKQLRLLLGISDPSDLNEGTETSSAYLKLWEKDLFLRIRTVEQITSSKLTIQSLAKLLGKISNIVINDQVGDAVYLSVENIYGASDALFNGKLFEAYNKSKTAFLSSEQAFTDPSLLALLYFPDDQKYAVYIPLFLPIMMPILISFKRIKQWAIRKFKKSSKVKAE